MGTRARRGPGGAWNLAGRGIAAFQLTSISLPRSDYEHALAVAVVSALNTTSGPRNADFVA